MTALGFTSVVKLLNPIHSISLPSLLALRSCLIMLKSTIRLTKNVVHMTQTKGFAMSTPKFYERGSLSLILLKVQMKCFFLFLNLRAAQIRKIVVYRFLISLLVPEL